MPISLSERAAHSLFKKVKEHTTMAIQITIHNMQNAQPPVGEVQRVFVCVCVRESEKVRQSSRNRGILILVSHPVHVKSEEDLVHIAVGILRHALQTQDGLKLEQRNQTRRRFPHELVVPVVHVFR